jgi:hypothetical protein
VFGEIRPVKYRFNYESRSNHHTARCLIRGTLSKSNISKGLPYKDWISILKSPPIFGQVYKSCEWWRDCGGRSKDYFCFNFYSPCLLAPIGDRSSFGLCAASSFMISCIMSQIFRSKALQPLVLALLFMYKLSVEGLKIKRRLGCFCPCKV